ncbi:hypothetical protein ROLI_042720 [Roseobacter fucihabitans]|uniref:Transposase n=1 Tax=Roseobacter fucihabitans TaxID=1537242 RepID=A0ABZ2BZM6_9RHOB|nr:hypothetical protein [Roseobacter litoralis]
MGRWKAVIRPKLKARSFDNQKTEAKIGAHVLNRMTKLGRPHRLKSASGRARSEPKLIRATRSLGTKNGLFNLRQLSFQYPAQCCGMVRSAQLGCNKLEDG